jgi:predicted O-methyltransferase YrrM
MDTCAIPQELSLDTGWCLGEATFAVLIQELHSFPVRSLIEFGSGVSSARLALSLPHVKIVSIESDPSHHQRTMQLLERFVPHHDVSLELRTLCWQRHGLAFYQGYGVGQLPASVDAIIVDGPPGWTARGRESCLYQVFQSLRVGGRVFLDDYDRPAERQIVRNWQASYPGVFDVRELETSPTRLCVLEKKREFTGTRLSFQVAWDNWYYHAHTNAVALRDRIFGGVKS